MKVCAARASSSSCVALQVASLLSMVAAACSRSPSGPGTDAGHGLGRADVTVSETGARSDAQRRADSQAIKGDGATDATLRKGDAGDARGADARRADATAVDAPVDAAPPLSDAPTATTLALSLPLVPPFSTSVHDYYIRCAAGQNDLGVAMTAAPGSTIALLQPATTPPAVATTASVSVAEGAALVVGVTAGAATEEYWVRCLPHDFATLQFTPHADAGTPPPGYYLLGDIYDDAPVQGGYAMVLDGNGVPVWYGKTYSGVEPVDVENLIPATLSFTPYIGFTFGDAAVGEFEIRNLEAGTTSYVDTVGVPLDLHELRVLPNGDYLVLAVPILTGVDLTGLPGLGPDENMIDCVIQEISPAGALVWQWDAMDHFDPVKDSTYPIVKPLGTTTTVNTFHCNSIDVDPTTGDLLVSGRCMDSVFRVSRPGGQILWKMGGSTYTKENAPYIAVTDDPMTSFYRQHDARFLSDGTISMFDDHTAISTGAARGVVYSYDVDAGTAKMVWQYAGSQSSYAMGSFRILADGSRVISWGSSSGMLGFTEVDEAGHDLVDFSFADQRWTYRAIKVPSTALDLATLRRTAGTQ